MQDCIENTSIKFSLDDGPSCAAIVTTIWSPCRLNFLSVKELRTVTCILLNNDVLSHSAKSQSRQPSFDVREGNSTFAKRPICISMKSQTKRKLPGERVSDFKFTYDMSHEILFSVTSIFRFPLKLHFMLKNIHQFVL